MAKKSPDFVNPTVQKTINTVAGTAHYIGTEIEDDHGRWNDNYYTRDGYWVIHEGKHHHVYKIQPKGKGWRESPGRDGKAPIHKEVATRAQAKGAQNTPMKKARDKDTQKYGDILYPPKKSNIQIGTKVKLRDDVLQRWRDTLLPLYRTGLTREEFERGTTLKELKGKIGVVVQFYPNSEMDVDFNGHLIRIGESELVVQNTPMTKPHRKLTEKERDRMIDLHASAPLTYRPSIDDKLMKLGLVQFWDNTPDAVENTDVPFYDNSGRILPEWYDFKAETARHDAARAAKPKYVPPYRVDVWEERDRLIITVYDKNDKEVASWVDEEAREMFVDGFFNSRDVEGSVLEYLKNVDVIGV